MLVRWLHVLSYVASKLEDTEEKDENVDSFLYEEPNDDVFGNICIMLDCDYRNRTFSLTLCRSTDSVVDNGTIMLDCDDDVINIIEVKYAKKPFRVTKQYATQLGDKIDIFKEQTKTKKDVYLMMMTVSGLLENAYTDDLVANALALDDLLR